MDPPSNGLVNGARLLVEKVKTYSIEAKITNRTHAGKKVSVTIETGSRGGSSERRLYITLYIALSILLSSLLRATNHGLGGPVSSTAN